jgi:flagellar biosynthesis/type III secretory pathway M-ring protein FliF/YscJ
MGAMLVGTAVGVVVMVAAFLLQRVADNRRQRMESEQREAVERGRSQRRKAARPPEA